MRLLAVLLLALAGPPVLDTAGLLGLTTGLAAGLAVTVLAAAVLVQLAPPAAPVTVHTARMREVARQTAFLRLRDPDARGRTRPRAPSLRSTAV